MQISNNEVGETIRTLRRAKGMTRAVLSEKVDISESHLGKIEAGSRNPGIITYQKIMMELQVETIFKIEASAAKGKCIEKVQEILWNSTEQQAIHLTKMLEAWHDAIL